MEWISIPRNARAVNDPDSDVLMNFPISESKGGCSRPRPGARAGELLEHTAEVFHISEPNLFSNFVDFQGRGREKPLGFLDADPRDVFRERFTRLPCELPAQVVLGNTGSGRHVTQAEGRVRELFPYEPLGEHDNAGFPVRRDRAVR